MQITSAVTKLNTYVLVSCCHDWHEKNSFVAQNEQNAYHGSGKRQHHYGSLTDHADSLEYGEDRGREVFWKHNRMCREVDAVIAFVPEASMGTAIEMWEAYEAGRAVITISPLVHNWAVVFLSHARYDDFDDFVAALASGEVERTIEEVID